MIKLSMKMDKKWESYLKNFAGKNIPTMNKTTSDFVDKVANHFALMLRQNIKRGKVGGPKLTEEWVAKKKRLDYPFPKKKWLGSMDLYNSIGCYKNGNTVSAGFPPLPIGKTGLTYGGLARMLEFGHFVRPGVGKTYIVNGKRYSLPKYMVGKPRNKGFGYKKRIPARPVFRPTYNSWKPYFEQQRSKFHKKVFENFVGGL